jgi:flagellar biogenesis protein FliO
MQTGTFENSTLVTVAVLMAMACLSAQAARANVPSSRPTHPPATQVLKPADALPSALEREPIRRDLRNRQSAATQPANPAPRSSSGSGIDGKRLGLSVALVIGVIVAARFATRRLFPAAQVARSSQAIRVLSRSVLAPKQQFLLLRVGNRLIVVGDTGQSMTPLCEITEPAEVAALMGQLSSEATQSSGSAFSSLFRKNSADFEAAQAPAASEQQQPLLGEAGGELSGLLDRVRLLTRQLRRSP